MPPLNRGLYESLFHIKALFLDGSGIHLLLAHWNFRFPPLEFSDAPLRLIRDFSIRINDCRMKLSPHNLKRYKDLTLLLLKYGQTSVASKFAFYEGPEANGHGPSDATELPALYEVKDGEPSLVNFDVRDGTYVAPKLIDRGYLALGKARWSFAQQGRR